MHSKLIATWPVNELNDNPCGHRHVVVVLLLNKLKFPPSFPPDDLFAGTSCPTHIPVSLPGAAGSLSHRCKQKLLNGSFSAKLNRKTCISKQVSFNHVLTRVNEFPAFYMRFCFKKKCISMRCLVPL